MLSPFLSYFLAIIEFSVMIVSSAPPASQAATYVTAKSVDYHKVTAPASALKAENFNTGFVTVFIN